MPTDSALPHKPTRLPRGVAPYAKRLLKEEVLEHIMSPDGLVELARITRNRYEAQVLNTHRVLFVDVDTAWPARQGEEAVALSPSPASPKKTVYVSRETALAALARLVAEVPELGFRVYDTRAGLRYLCTTHLFDPASPETEALFARLHTDVRYAALCRVQGCFRARLTPKPWRCQVPAEGSPGFLRRLLGWGPRIVRDTSRFSTCQLAGLFGSARVLPEIACLVERHDALTEAASQKPLA